jgi:hypothetical protein
MTTVAFDAKRWSRERAERKIDRLIMAEARDLFEGADWGDDFESVDDLLDEIAWYGIFLEDEDSYPLSPGEREELIQDGWTYLSRG